MVIVKKKEVTTKDEALIMLQSQPLSADLWRLAYSQHKENAIRFPDPSYLDSQSWPDYMNSRKRNGAKSGSKVKSEQLPVEPFDKQIRQEISVENKTSVDKESLAVYPGGENHKTIEEHESGAGNASSTTEKKVKRMRRKKQEKVNEMLTNDHPASMESESFSQTTSSQSEEALDFYEWLEELKTNRIAVRTEKKSLKNIKSKSKSTDAVETAENSLILGDEIVSETLARLLIRQGHIADAIEMYEKLMIKFPEKAATFAAALEKLKS